MVNVHGSFLSCQKRLGIGMCRNLSKWNQCAICPIELSVQSTLVSLLSPMLPCDSFRCASSFPEDLRLSQKRFSKEKLKFPHANLAVFVSGTSSEPSTPPDEPDELFGLAYGWQILIIISVSAVLIILVAVVIKCHKGEKTEQSSATNNE